MVFLIGNDTPPLSDICLGTKISVKNIKNLQWFFWIENDAPPRTSSKEHPFWWVQMSLMILFLSSYHRVSDTTCWDSGSCCSCSNWSHSLFLQPAACRAAHTPPYQLMREKGASSQDNLQVIDQPAAAPAAVTRSPFLPSFHKTPSTHRLKSSWRTET